MQEVFECQATFKRNKIFIGCTLVRVIIDADGAPLTEARAALFNLAFSMSPTEFAFERVYSLTYILIDRDLGCNADSRMNLITLKFQKVREKEKKHESIVTARTLGAVGRTFDSL